MKVKELIEKLQTVDPELDVFISRGIYLEHLKSGRRENDEKSFKKGPDFTKKYPIESISGYRGIPPFPEEEYLVLMFDDSWEDQIEG